MQLASGSGVDSILGNEGQAILFVGGWICNLLAVYFDKILLLHLAIIKSRIYKGQIEGCCHGRGTLCVTPLAVCLVLV